MVRIIDGYQEKINFQEKYNLFYSLAKKFFGERVGSKNLDNFLSNIRIYTGSSKNIISESNPECIYPLSVEIFPSINKLEVHKESDYDTALALAKKGEKLTSEEFILETTYKLKRNS